MYCQFIAWLASSKHSNTRQGSQHHGLRFVFFSLQELVAQALKAVGLSGVEPLFPGELSGGMKKRVALARAIIRDSENDHAEQVWHP